MSAESRAESTGKLRCVGHYRDLAVARAVLDADAFVRFDDALGFLVHRIPRFAAACARPSSRRCCCALLDPPGRVVSAERLAMAVWGKATAPQRHALKQVIYRLRRKLAAEAEFADRLLTARNAGYRWWTQR